MPMLFSFLPNIERNLNPKQACLRRREEEKSEEVAGLHYAGKIAASSSENDPGRPSSSTPGYDHGKLLTTYCYLSKTNYCNSSLSPTGLYQTASTSYPDLQSSAVAALRYQIDYPTSSSTAAGCFGGEWSENAVSSSSTAAFLQPFETKQSSSQLLKPDFSQSGENGSGAYSDDSRDGDDAETLSKNPSSEDSP